MAPIFVEPHRVPALERVLAKAQADEHFSVASRTKSTWMGTPGADDRRFVIDGWLVVQRDSHVSLETCLRFEELSQKWHFHLYSWLAEERVDPLVTDRAYWKGVFAKLRETVFVARRSPHDKETFERKLRVWRYGERLARQQSARKGYADLYGQEVMNWLDAELVRAERGCDFVDNERVACLARRKDVGRYHRQRKRGCCGEHDEVVTHPGTGLRFLIGFNYGH